MGSDKERLASLSDLQRAVNGTLKVSLRTLRSRAENGILVYANSLAEDGRTRLYDRQLSVIRLKAAHGIKRKNPVLKWKAIAEAFKKADNADPPLNAQICQPLYGSPDEDAAVEKVAKAIMALLN